MDTISERIQALKREKNAMVLAHLYQDLEIQQIADVAGDSFELAKRAAESDADVLVVCGVAFMAESAKLLSPGKTVLLPRHDAGCVMADMITPDDVAVLRDRHPGAAVMGYVNTSAAVKAVCDVCCTSSSAVAIARRLDADTVIFLPDRNLGAYVAAQVPDKEFIYFDGCCPIHDHVPLKTLETLRRLYPDALIAVHPECRPDVAAAADFVGSTSQMINRVVHGGEAKYIIGTEITIVELLRERVPDKVIYPLATSMVCSNMRKTRLEDVLYALENGVYQVDVPEDTAFGARRALARMIELGA